MRALLRPAVLALSLAACDSATPPDRPPPYPYAIQLQDGTILAFRWSDASLPVRIWIQPDADLESFVEAAIREWEGVALYREFTGVIVRDSAAADVLVRLGTPYSVHPSFTRNCGSSTTIGVERDTTITLPFVTTLFPRLGVGDADVNACFDLATTHELGHALGLFLHSDDPQDLMYDIPSPEGLSPRDRATFTTLYHSPVSVRLPVGR